MEHVVRRLVCLATVVGLAFGTAAGEYTATTAASKWSEIDAGEWSPSEFVSDAASTGTVNATGASFAFDTAITAAKVALVAGADMSVTMPTTPTAGEIVLDGSSHLVTFASGLPGRKVCCRGDVNISTLSTTAGLVLDILDGTTTLSGSGKFVVENKYITFNVRGGTLQNASGLQIYTGFTGGSHQYFNVCGGRMTSRLAIANNGAKGTHVSVTAGEFAPTAINYSDGSSAATVYQYDCVPIALSGGTFSVPSTLPVWAPVTVSGTAGAIRSDTPGGSKVYSRITIPEGASLSLVPGQGGLTILTDVAGTGTLVVDGGCLRPANTNRFAGAIRFVTGKKLVFDTSLLSGEEGAIVAEGGFVFPEGKTIADITEFVTLPNPYTFGLEVGEDGKSLFARRTGSVDYTVSTASSTWSGIADGEWQPHAFFDDRDSTVRITTSASTFSVDETVTVGELRIQSGGTQMTAVAFPGALNATRTILDGANGKIVLSGTVPSVSGLVFDGTVELSSNFPMNSGQSFTVVGGTTTFTYDGLVNVENRSITINVEGGEVRTTANGHLYTGHNSGMRTYNISGGKFACALTIPNKDSRGIRINVSGGEFAPPFIRYHQGGSGIGDYSGTAMDIQMSGGLITAPSVLPDWAPVSVTGDAQIRGLGHSVVHSALTIAEGCTLSAAPSEANTSIAFRRDIQGKGTFAVANDLTWRLISTNHLAGAMRFVTGKKLTLDTSILETEGGAIIADVGFIFPEGKSLADIDEFVTLSNPYAYELLVIDAGTLAVCSRGAITYTAHTAAAKWSEIEDSEWDPFAYVPDASSIATVYSTAAGFAFDSAFIGDDIRFVTDSGAACNMTFTASPKVKALTVDGSNGLINVTSALPAGIPKLQFCGDVDISVYQPAANGCSSFDILDGTTTFRAVRDNIIHVENISLTINVRGGLLQNAPGTSIYTGFRGDAHQYFNVYGGKMTSRLGIATHEARGSHVNVYGGEFAPTSIDAVRESGDWKTYYNGAAVPIRLMGGVFSVPAVLPTWAEIEAVSNATVRAQGNASVYSTVKIDEDATLTVADSENGGLLMLLNDVTGPGTLALDGDLAVRPGIKIEGKLRFRAGHALLIAADETTVTNAQLTVEGGMEFEGCGQRDLQRLVRFAGSRFHGYVPIICGKALRMIREGSCIIVR